MNKLIRSFCIGCFVWGILFVPCVFAINFEYYGDIEEFKKYNPDGKKYEFVRDYLVSLSYLKVIEQRNSDNASITYKDFLNIERVQELKNRLILDNANLRVAKNYLDDYEQDPQNGLMLQVTVMFTRMCGALIDLNSQEWKMMEEYYQAMIHNKLKQFDSPKFLNEQVRLASQRKEIFKDLLRSAVLVNKVLISDREDLYGELVTLGITQEQRYKLLRRIDELYGVEYEGQVKPGQSFLTGSVIAIRALLEDYTWDTLDG